MDRLANKINTTFIATEHKFKKNTVLVARLRKVKLNENTLLVFLKYIDYLNLNLMKS